MRSPCLIFLLTSALVFSVLPLCAQDILFKENFDDGTAGGFEPDNDMWIVNDAGQYQIENWGFEVLSYSYFGQYHWTNFSLTLDVLTHDGAHHGVGFRVQENGDMYVATLRGEPYKDVFLSKIVNGRQYQLSTAPLSHDLSEWHHLGITTSQNHIHFSVDGISALSYTDTDSPLQSGRQALVSYTGGVAQHQLLQIDNIRVIKPVVSGNLTSQH